MPRAIFFIGAILFILICEGCDNHASEVISHALASTNVLFQPNLQEPITLSASQAETVKRIVKRFNGPGVGVVKDILQHESGRFIMGKEHFGWLGRSLYFYDPKKEKYYFVEDDTLGNMADHYFKVQGQPPLKSPSQEQWKEILSTLEK